MTRSLTLLSAVVVASVGSAQSKVGQRHPDFTLPNIADGKPVSLTDYLGKKVLLIQFASW